MDSNTKQCCDDHLPSSSSKEEDNGGDLPPVSSSPSFTEDGATDNDDDDEPTQGGSSSQEQAVSIRWDDDLCRPIYIRPESGESQNRSSSDVIVTSEGDDDDDDNEDAAEDSGGEISSLSSDNKEASVTIDDNGELETAAVVPFVLPEVLQNAKTRGRKRNKTFGDRNVTRRPLSLILSQHRDEKEEAQSPYDSSATEEGNKRQRTAVNNPMDSLATLAPSLSSINTRRVSSSPVVQETSDEEDDAFAFPVDGSDKKTKANSLSPLKRVREFFEDLDKTQKLTLDSSMSPSMSGKVVRTSRQVDLSSPSVSRAYQAYVEATESSGVTPLTIKDFVKSRKLHFETKGGNLFDGFLDDC